ncbi:Hypothetical Protein FCC1311_075832 [Hondaea fermentalgiana]|uniref:Fe2OG dioxygenase domain-containing protein n=1 Tax=Hondaea fermentalgiana TaxID=2315210 RepID=A0A2R5GM15_9STRA|nr:Hypothetical Protein FCC1311_075832 [Hondaea fermentalgiana]|eukprot:GBG31359.1 Hypothetical Protein FCC1311_075832 [Hondaea fermentalgiana]
MSLHADAAPFVPPAAGMAPLTEAMANLTTAPKASPVPTTASGTTVESKTREDSERNNTRRKDSPATGRKSRGAAAGKAHRRGGSKGDNSSGNQVGGAKNRENRDKNGPEGRPSSRNGRDRNASVPSPVDGENANNPNNKSSNKGRNNNKNSNKQRLRKPKNTTDFTPRFDKPDLRVKVLTNGRKLHNLSVHDVVFAPDLFCAEEDMSIFESLKEEIHQAQGNEDLFTLWHGDTHEIANDKFQRGEWKKKSPAFNAVIRKIEEAFDMKINATRFNLYRKGSTDWKPFHHDRAAFTPDCPQNFTVAASFGLGREVGFEHARNKTKVFLEAPNGSAYTFSRDVNIEFKHGVIPLEGPAPEDRISIIAWGLSSMSAKGSRVTENDVPSAEDLGLVKKFGR